VSLLPTPAVNDMGEGKTVEHWDEWTATMQAKHGNGNGHGKSLAIEAQRLLPTPSVADGMGGHLTRSGARSGELLLPGVAKSIGEHRLLPTPTCGDAKSARNSTATRHVLPPTGIHAGNTLTDILVPKEK
jgi:DNA (cytosine-5)-methyltransferase 1